MNYEDSDLDYASILDHLPDLVLGFNPNYTIEVYKNVLMLFNRGFHKIRKITQKVIQEF